MFAILTKYIKLHKFATTSSNFRKIYYLRHASSYCSKHTCTRPHPLYHARTPQHATRPQGDTYDDTILAGVVSKNPKI